MPKPEMRMEHPDFVLASKFLGLYKLKFDACCNNCGDIVRWGTPVVQSIGKYDEGIICPKCFNHIRSTLIHMDLKDHPEPVIDYHDEIPDDVPPQADKECPKCKGHTFHITYLAHVQDRFKMDPSDGTPTWIGLAWPDQDPGTIVSIQCDECMETLYHREYD
jgi:hypothetical protein